MPVFHTKTIESILEPVAQQVSRLVILHEEAEDGNAMPDLSRPVQAVSKAVTNLVKVGKDTINNSDDMILRQDMPSALQRVEQASKLLEEASQMLKADPFSQPARKTLIEGSRGILQGTSALLLCFDESEVRKIIHECKKVLDYLAVAEVIESMEDLVQFVKDLSPCLTKVSRDVDAREKELTHQVHREILIRCLESVKTLAPILICSMKIFVQILSQGGKGTDEAAENRNYLSQRMTDEINEIIRVLQLTTYDEDEWEADNLTAMKRAQNAVGGKLQSAHEWLADPVALTGGIGEKSVRQILDYAQKIADRALPLDRDSLKKSCDEIATMTNTLCDLRHQGKAEKEMQCGSPLRKLRKTTEQGVRAKCKRCGTELEGQVVRMKIHLKNVKKEKWMNKLKLGSSPQAKSLSQGISQKLNDLNNLISQAVLNMDRSGIQQPAHTIIGRVEQAQRWLNTPGYDDKGLGLQAIKLIVEEGKRVADNCPPQQRAEIYHLCNDVDALSRQLSELCHRGQGNTPQAQAVARTVSAKIYDLKAKIQKALVNKVAEDFIDISTPLKQFTEAVLAAEGTPNREGNFQDKARALADFTHRVAHTARSVASGGTTNKKVAEALLASAYQVEHLTPQLVSAGRIRMSYPENKAADEHFENLRKQYAESMQKMRQLADEATDTVGFIKATEDCIIQHTNACEDAINRQVPQQMVDNTSSIARLANRVLMVAKQESDNSEDPHFVTKVNISADQLQSSVTPMVQDAKSVTLDMTNHVAISRWRDSNKALITAVGQVRHAVTVTPDEEVPIIPPPPDMSTLQLNEVAPPRPPLPHTDDLAPPRPPPPETDDEFEARFPSPLPNQPIMLAAHGLHQEVRQWSSKDNEIIAAAKKMALLMAKLSQLVRGEGGSKKDLIACAKSIAEASEEVTRLAKELARMCTDKRMRTNILQVCERIPTIGTQLRILSTVKATMLGAQAPIITPDGSEIICGTEEDQEATDMLVGNAQNLMQSVKETVRACEAASIKIRTDSGIRVRWIRKQPWYQY